MKYSINSDITVLLACCTIRFSNVRISAELEDKPVEQHFYDEVHVMQLVSIGKHPNVVNLLACCTLHSPKMAILELAMKGSLLEFLRRKDMYNYVREYHLSGIVT